MHKEWIEYNIYYQDFLSEGTGQEEASKFLVNGFFLSELGDTLVRALCNALQIPVIVLTSIHDAPILHFNPRSCLVLAPIIIGYNQYGAGHYDAIAYFKPIHRDSSKSSCKCGVNDSSTVISRCCPNKKYVCRCPCLKNTVGCTSKCRCKQCDNPNGKRPTVLYEKQTRKRQHHELQSIHLYNTSFLMQRKENLTKGDWSQLENILFTKILNYLQLKEENITPENVHRVYIS